MNCCHCVKQICGEFMPYGCEPFIGLQLMQTKELMFIAIMGTRENRGWHGFSPGGKCRYLFHKDFHKQFPLELAITYRSRKASAVEGFSFSRRDSGTIALTKTRSAS
jgi:hypothetical protein